MLSIKYSNNLIISGSENFFFKKAHRVLFLKIIIGTRYLFISWQFISFKWFIRDRPFNLRGRGGVWCFVLFRIFFRITRELEYFFSELNIRLYDKNSESDYFVSSTKIIIFFQQHWESEYFFRKKNITLPPFKLNGRSPTLHRKLKI
jgi:hypothetical protein